MQPEQIARLKTFFERNGHLRRPDPIRQQEGHQSYKKGYEVRLIARDEAELRIIRELLSAANFRLASSFVKSRQFVQPIYGKAAVERFCKLIGHPLDLPATDAARSQS